MQLAANINQHNNVLHSFKRSVLSKSNGQNLKLMKQMREENEMFRRAVLQTKSGKWDKFREQRAIVIDRYIKQKKKCMIVAQFCK